MPKVPPLPLSAEQKLLRAFAALFILGFLIFAYLLDPNQPSSLWFIPEFGNIVGLPCLLCGGTRAMHFLLHGDLHKAFYFNWIALPALVGAVGLVLVMSIELAQSKALLPPVKIPAKKVAILVAVGISLWAHHVYDALYTPKPELLNQRGIFFQLTSPNDNPGETR